MISVSAIVGRAEPKRQRLNVDCETNCAAILSALSSLGEQNALTVKILLATCTRIGELAKAEWSHVDFERAEWFIPDANSKTGKGFTVPLVPSVVDWFNDLQPFSCGSRFILPARQMRRKRSYGQEVNFDQRTLNSALHKLCDRLGDETRRFTPHDLRSTARSHLAALGVNVVVAERCLNHSLGGLLAVYDQHDYMTERRGALELWAGHILAYEAGTNFNAPQLRNADV